MAGNGNIDNLTPWNKGQSGNPNGRPRKFVTQLKVMGYKVDEINTTITNLLSMTISELKAVGDDEDATILEVMVARALFKDAGKGSLQSMETLMSRVFGAPKQSFEETIVEQPFFPDVKYDNVEDAEIEDE